MARTPNPVPARRPAQQPPPAQEEQQQVDSVYEEVWGAITSAKPDFQGPGPREGDQGFIQRLTRAISEVPEETWDSLSKEAQEWYDKAAEAMTNRSELPAPQGYGDDDAGDEGAETEAATNGAAAEAQPAQPRKSGRDTLMEINARRKREREEREAAAAEAATQPAPGARRSIAPAGRGAPAASAAPARRQPAAPPQRGAAPAARKQAAPRKSAEERGPSMMEEMRRFIVHNLDTNVEEVKGYMMENFNFDAKDSTTVGVLTTTRATCATVKNEGHWKD